MNIITVNIGAGWTPDITPEDTLKIGGLQVCDNVLPVNQYYKPISGKLTYNPNAVVGTPLNGMYVQDIDGNYYNFLGTSSKLYRFDKSTLTDVTRTSGDYSSSSWNFAEYGDWLIATDYSDDIQVLKGYTSANFQALGGSPPKAKFCLMNNTHLVLAHLNEGGTVYPKKLKWSARENPEDWTASLITGAGSQNLPDISGNITGLGAFGENFVIASENSISVGYFTGTMLTFEFQINAVKNIGCYYPQSFISIGDAIFFWGKDSIYMFNGSIKDIGKYIKNTVLSNIAIQYMNRITVAQDKEKNLIIWSYPSTSSNGTPDRMLIYNYVDDKWASATISAECLFMGASGGIFIDDMNMLIDDMNYLIDSNYWLNKNIIPMVVDSDGIIKTLTGASLTAELQTGEFNNEPSIIMARKAYIPVYNLTGTGSITVKHRRSTIDSYSSSNANAIKSDGSVDLRASNKRLALNIQVNNFSKFGNEIKVDGVGVGER